MSAPLLVVEEAFVVAGLGVVVRPEPDDLDPTAKRIAVELRRPDGTSSMAMAVVRTPHLAPADRSRPPRRLLALEDVGPEEVPVGTSIFVVASD